MTWDANSPLLVGFFSNLATLSKAKQILEIGTYCNSQGQ